MEVRFCDICWFKFDEWTQKDENPVSSLKVMAKKPRASQKFWKLWVLTFLAITLWPMIRLWYSLAQMIANDVWNQMIYGLAGFDKICAIYGQSFANVAMRIRIRFDSINPFNPAYIGYLFEQKNSTHWPHRVEAKKYQNLCKFFHFFGHNFMLYGYKWVGFSSCFRKESKLISKTC